MAGERVRELIPFFHVADVRASICFYQKLGFAVRAGESERSERYLESMSSDGPGAYTVCQGDAAWSPWHGTSATPGASRFAEIADRLGRSPATVNLYFYDPTGEKARGQGAPPAGVPRRRPYTQARNGKGDAHAYCKRCHEGAIARRWTRERALRKGRNASPALAANSGARCMPPRARPPVRSGCVLRIDVSGTSGPGPYYPLPVQPASAGFIRAASEAPGAAGDWIAA